MLDGAGTVIPLSGGRDFVAKSIFRVFSNSFLDRKHALQHFCQTLNFYSGFAGNRLGQNVRNDRGILSDLHKRNHCVLHWKVNMFSKTSISIFSAQTIYFSL